MSLLLGILLFGGALALFLHLFFVAGWQGAIEDQRQVVLRKGDRLILTRMGLGDRGEPVACPVEYKVCGAEQAPDGAVRLALVELRPAPGHARLV